MLYQYLKIGGGRLGVCLCVVALVYSSFVLYLKFSDDLQLVVTTRQSSLPNAVVRQSGERLAPGCLSIASLGPRVLALFLFVCFEHSLG